MRLSIKICHQRLLSTRKSDVRTRNINFDPKDSYIGHLTNRPRAHTTRLLHQSYLSSHFHLVDHFSNEVVRVVDEIKVLPFASSFLHLFFLPGHHQVKVPHQVPGKQFKAVIMFFILKVWDKKCNFFKTIGFLNIMGSLHVHLLECSYYEQ